MVSIHGNIPTCVAVLHLCPWRYRKCEYSSPPSLLEYATLNGVAVQLVRRTFHCSAIVDDEDTLLRVALDLVHLHGGEGVRALEDPPDFFGRKACTEQLN